MYSPLKMTNVKIRRFMIREKYLMNSLIDENDESESVQAKPKAFLPGEEIEEGEELVMDDQAYTIYHQASLGPPCLSFDIIPDHLGNDRADSYPLTMYGKKLNTLSSQYRFIRKASEITSDFKKKREDFLKI